MLNKITEEIARQVNEHVDLPCLTEEEEQILIEIITNVLISKIPALL
jgi:hypothetical protein